MLGRKEQEQQDIQERFENSTEENYLRIILDSYFQYNHRARLDAAKIYYDKFIELPDEEEYDNLKRVLIAEIFNKLMQALEDSALLAIMFMDKTKRPFEHFLSTDNRAYTDFFRKAKRGLSDNQILRIYGLKSATRLLNAGLIKKKEEKQFEVMLGNIVNDERLRWKKLGKLYSEQFTDPQSKKTSSRKTNVIRGYHNIKHAYKTLLPTDLYKKIWNHNENELTLSVIGQYKEFGKLFSRMPKKLQKYAKHKVIVLGSLEVSKKAAKELFERIHPMAQTMRTISEMHLNGLDDPEYPLREFIFAFYPKEKLTKLKHFMLCPCGSGLKYKKCHRDRPNLYDGLVFESEEE